jgi:hypothetical protein
MGQSEQLHYRSTRRRQLRALAWFICIAAAAACSPVHAQGDTNTRAAGASQLTDSLVRRLTQRVASLDSAINRESGPWRAEVLDLDRDVLLAKQATFDTAVSRMTHDLHLFEIGLTLFLFALAFFGFAELGKMERRLRDQLKSYLDDTVNATISSVYGQQQRDLEQRIEDLRKELGEVKDALRAKDITVEAHKPEAPEQEDRNVYEG